MEKNKHKGKKKELEDVLANWTHHDTTIYRQDQGGRRLTKKGKRKKEEGDVQLGRDRVKARARGTTC